MDIGEWTVDGEWSATPEMNRVYRESRMAHAGPEPFQRLARRGPPNEGYPDLAGRAQLVFVSHARCIVTP